MVGREEEGGGDGSMMGIEERDGTEHIVLPHHSPRQIRYGGAGGPYTTDVAIALPRRLLSHVRGAGRRQREADAGGGGVVLGAASGIRGAGGEGSAEVEETEGGGGLTWVIRPPIPPIQSADCGDIRGSTCNMGARGGGGEQAGRGRDVDADFTLLGNVWIHTTKAK